MLWGNKVMEYDGDFMPSRRVETEHLVLSANVPAYYGWTSEQARPLSGHLQWLQILRMYHTRWFTSQVCYVVIKG